MADPRELGIKGCANVPVSANRDHRGCLYEIYRQSWQGAFPTVQWNACVSGAGIVRGVHVHVDYDEFYTLPQGRVQLGLIDIRRGSKTFKKSVQFEWSDNEGVAVIVPRGVAHVVYFIEASILAFGLSDYWKPEVDVLGCRWDDSELGLNWTYQDVVQSSRDRQSGNFQQLLEEYEERAGALHDNITA